MRGWRKVDNELIDLYSPPNVIRMNKSRKMRWKWRITRMGEKRNGSRFSVGNSDGKKRYEGLDVGRKIILK